MADQYPPDWTPWLKQPDQPPTKPEVPPVDSLRSGAHTDHDDRYTTKPYPESWNTPRRYTDRPTHTPFDEAMRAAADHLAPEQ